MFFSRPLFIALGGSYLALTCLKPAFALPQWEFNPETQQLQFTLKASVTPSYFLLESPTRVVVDLPNTQLQGGSIQRNYQGLIQEVRIGQFKEETARIVLELAPKAILESDNISLTPTAGNQWQLNIPSLKFPVSALMTIPPLEEKTVISSQQVQVPPPPAKQSSQESQAELNLSAGTQLQLRYRGEKPLQLKLAQPWQEVLFLEENLINEEGELIVSAQTPVIGHFKTTSEGTRFVTQALITTVDPKATSRLNSVIPLSARSSLLTEPKVKLDSDQVTISPDTTFTIELIENWTYPR